MMTILKYFSHHHYYFYYNFFYTDNEKIKTILHSQSSLFYMVKISFLSYDRNVFGSFPRKTLFAMLYNVHL